MSETVRKFVGITANDRVVSVNTSKSHAATHLEAKEGLWECAAEAIRQVRVTEDDIAVQVDMGRPVGGMDLVETTPEESRIYGRRRNREAFSPFVVRDVQPVTNFIVLVLRILPVERLLTEEPEPRLLDDNLLSLPQHDLYSTYPGIITPGTPGGDPKYITNESIPFWMSHALVLGTQEIDEIYKGEGPPPAYRV